MSTIARAASQGTKGPPTYCVGGFSLANYYKSTLGVEPGGLGTYALCVRIDSLDTTFGVLVANGVGGGWYIAKNNAGGNRALGGVVYRVGGSTPLPDFIPFNSASALETSDVGKLMMIYFLADSSKARTDQAGCEEGVGTTTGTAPLTPAGDSLFYGRWSGGDPTSNYSIVASLYTPTVMTPAQIEQHAQVCMSRKHNLVFPQLPGETVRHLASDLAANPATWPDQHGNVNVARNGAPTITKLGNIRWVRNAGRIMAMGDSQVQDGFDTFKAAQFLAIRDYLTAHNIHFALVGPFSNGWVDGVTVIGSHRAVSGETAAQAHTGADTGGITLLTYVQTYRPRWTYPYWLTNDFGADGVSVATAQTRMTDCLDDIKTGAPWCHIYMATLVVPDGPMYIGAQANFIAWNAQLATYAAGQSVPYIDIGNPARFADGLHILGGSTGYGVYTPGTDSVDGIAAITMPTILQWTFGG